MPETIYRELGKIKILIVLRDPASRLLSFYRYLKGMTLIPEGLSLDSYIAMCEDYNDRISKSPGEKREDLIYRGIMDGFYADFLPEWNDYFRDSLKIVFFERLKEDPAVFMKEICAWLEIDPSIYLKGGYTVENRSVLYKSRSLHRVGLLLNRELEVVLRRFPKVKHGIRKLYYYK